MNFGYIGKKSNSEEYFRDIERLQNIGCTEIFQDKNRRFPNAKFEKLISIIGSDDCIYTCNLLNFYYSPLTLIEIIFKIYSKGAKLYSLDEIIEGRGNEFLGFYQYIQGHRKRTAINNGKEARSRGLKGGRKKGLNPEALEKAKAAVDLYKSKNFPINYICSVLKIKSKTTLYRYLRELGVEIG